MILTKTLGEQKIKKFLPALSLKNHITFILLYKRNKIHKTLFYFWILIVLNLSFNRSEEYTLK